MSKKKNRKKYELLLAYRNSYLDLLKKKVSRINKEQFFDAVAYNVKSNELTDVLYSMYKKFQRLPDYNLMSLSIELVNAYGSYDNVGIHDYADLLDIIDVFDYLNCAKLTLSENTKITNNTSYLEKHLEILEQEPDNYIFRKQVIKNVNSEDKVPFGQKMPVGLLNYSENFEVWSEISMEHIKEVFKDEKGDYLFSFLGFFENLNKNIDNISKAKARLKRKRQKRKDSFEISYLMQILKEQMNLIKLPVEKVMHDDMITVKNYCTRSVKDSEKFIEDPFNKRKAIIATKNNNYYCHKPYVGNIYSTSELIFDYFKKNRKKIPSTLKSYERSLSVEKGYTFEDAIIDSFDINEDMFAFGIGNRGSKAQPINYHLAKELFELLEEYTGIFDPSDQDIDAVSVDLNKNQVIVVEAKNRVLHGRRLCEYEYIWNRLKMNFDWSHKLVPKAKFIEKYPEKFNEVVKTLHDKDSELIYGNVQKALEYDFTKVKEVLPVIITKYYEPFASNHFRALYYQAELDNLLFNKIPINLTEIPREEFREIIDDEEKDFREAVTSLPLSWFSENKYPERRTEFISYHDELLKDIRKGFKKKYKKEQKKNGKRR